MSSPEISKAYTPLDVEPRWYQYWLNTDCFQADVTSNAPAYSLVMPPPNVTGVLTLGHVLNNTLQDILARRARQTGHEVLWLPGTDHAGIATQTVVERQLRKEEKKTRHDLGRPAFLERIWDWKKKHGGIILEQLQRLGCSCDWQRERFTMEESYSKKVQETFVDLYQKGLIYRGKRMVNWCPVSLTALSDEEVIPKKQKGILYHFKLEIIEEPGTWVEIATTRPETIMADAALAVNPEDPRYASLIGKHVRRPLPACTTIDIPILGDSAVDIAFGTGVLKVTPAHDQLDYEIGLRHGLPLIDIMNPNGTLNSLAGEEFAGQDRFEARLKAAEALRSLGLLVKEEPHDNNVGFSERADVPIEPRLSEQWFLRYPKTAEARAAVQQQLVHFFPERWEKVYDHWLENIQDWCISRQLWWGHQIPAWYAPTTANNQQERPITEASTEIKVQIESPGEGWIQDQDVLDTWFSSWLWAHESMDAATQQKFYPTSVLVTGPDIIFFWVARMIMAGLEYTNALPFKDVYFTGIIRDKQGRKMSKSLGNSPNPLDLIATYGADGLRFGMMRSAPHGQDIRFDEQQIAEGRNFANKLWNAARFREMHGPSHPSPNLSDYELPDIAITLLSKFDVMHAALRTAYADYRFQEIATQLYHFFWNDYCDWFVEAAKPTLHSNDETAKAALCATMDYVLAGVLHLLHPLMPHITEELWSRLGFQAASSHPGRPSCLLYTKPPQDSSLSHLSLEKVELACLSTEALYDAVRAARNLRGEFKINAKQAINFLITPKNKDCWKSPELLIFSALARGKEITLSEENPPKESASILTDLGTITIPLEGLIDLEAEQKRLIEEIKNVEGEIMKVQTKLANPAFVEKVPAAVLLEHREREEHWKERLLSLQRMLKKMT